MEIIMNKLYRCIQSEKNKSRVLSHLLFYRNVFLSLILHICTSVHSRFIGCLPLENSYLCNKCKKRMKTVPRVAGEWDNTSSAITLFTRVAYNIFSTIEQKNEKKNNDKQQFNPVRRV
jgi:hypothetical protein